MNWRQLKLLQTEDIKTIYELLSDCKIIRREDGQLFACRRDDSFGSR
jgi:hypothetical protein